MSQAARWTIAGLFFLAMFVEMVTRGESWELTNTSHGIIPSGHGAAYELLMQLELGAGRSYEDERNLSETATVWWIEPDGLCSDTGDGPLDCLAEGVLVGEPAPARDLDIDDEDWDDADRYVKIHDEALSITTVTGQILRQPRMLTAMPFHYFRNAPNYEVLVSDEKFGPFVISREIGEGRLVLVASAQPLRNRGLREADAAPFVVDLALAFGPPLIDEREHGILPRPLPN